MQTHSIVTILIRIHGSFTYKLFVPWIQERSERLGVHSSLKYHSNELLEITASGHEILVDALALACSLGPMSTTVDDVEVILLNSTNTDETSMRIDH